MKICQATSVLVKTGQGTDTLTEELYTFLCVSR